MNLISIGKKIAVALECELWFSYQLRLYKQQPQRNGIYIKKLNAKAIERATELKANGKQ